MEFQHLRGHQFLRSSWGLGLCLGAGALSGQVPKLKLKELSIWMASWEHSLFLLLKNLTNACAKEKVRPISFLRPHLSSSPIITHKNWNNQTWHYCRTLELPLLV